MNDTLTPGYFGIGIQHGKTPANLGVLWRSAQNFGAAFLFTIGKRYQSQSGDTTGASSAMPLFHYGTFDDFYAHLPRGAMLIGLEHGPGVEALESFEHPRRCVYLLGAEDHGLTTEARERCHRLVGFDTPHSINVAVAGSIVMFDRRTKRRAHGLD